MRPDLAELAQDIEALTGGAPAGLAHAERWLTQPAIARRIAAELASAIPAGVDRIVASGEFAEALGMAVALASGLPVAIVTEEGRMLGDRHPGETVFAVALTEPAAGDGPLPDLVVFGTRAAAPCLFRSTPHGLVPVARPLNPEENR